MLNEGAGRAGNGNIAIQQLRKTSPAEGRSGAAARAPTAAAAVAGLG
jgi:hypothetical protein